MNPGDRHNKLTIQYECEVPLDSPVRGKHYYCKCDCGRFAIVPGTYIKRSRKKTCGQCHRRGGNKKKIKLALTVGDMIYSPQFGQLVWTRDGNRVRKGDIVGSVNQDGYRVTHVEGKTYQCHRLIWSAYNGLIPPKMQIDHINGQPDDNRIENLRLVTVSQNQMNQKLAKGSSSGVKGVNWNEREGKWLCTVTKDGKQHKKLTKTKEEGIIWVRAKRQELHRDFTNHG